MHVLELGLWLWTLGCLAIGAAAIYRIHVSVGRHPFGPGHGLGLIAFLLLVLSMAVAAFYRPETLAAQGLAAGLLVAGMLWEHPPVPAVEQT